MRSGGFLIFSDIPANVINKWNPADGKVSVFLDKSGFTGARRDRRRRGTDERAGARTIYLIGSNGVTLDPQGRVTFNAMGDRQVVRVEADGRRTVLASRFEGKRLNSTKTTSSTSGTARCTSPILLPVFAGGMTTREKSCRSTAYTSSRAESFNCWQRIWRIPTASRSHPTKRSFTSTAAPTGRSSGSTCRPTTPSPTVD